MTADATQSSESTNDRVENGVGTRLHQLRRLSGLTLREVAEGSGLSHTFLSMVERGEADISLSRFRRLADFFGVAPGELLADAESHPRFGTLADSAVIDRGPGILYRLLPNQELGAQVSHMIFEPGATFANALTHPGSEIVWILQGLLTLEYGERRYQARAGTCVSYRSTVPHRWANTTARRGALILVGSPPYW